MQQCFVRPERAEVCKIIHVAKCIYVGSIAVLKICPAFIYAVNCGETGKARQTPSVACVRQSKVIYDCAGTGTLGTRVRCWPRWLAC